MNKRRPNASSALVVESLEARVVLSSATTTMNSDIAEVSVEAVKNARTATTLEATAGTLGQPIAISVTVRAPASAGSPTGIVNILDHGKVVQTLTLQATTSTNLNYAYSFASDYLTQQPGSSAYYFGKHSLTAEFVPEGAFAKSSGKGTFTVSEPDYTALADGVEYATIASGTGPQIQSGQTASVLYTGYLAKNGKIFDDSVNDGGSPFSFQLGAGQVITGFDEGTTGMQVGETRLILIPPAEGYGSTADGPIPKNSTLLFVVTLEGIS